LIDNTPQISNQKVTRELQMNTSIILKERNKMTIECPYSAWVQQAFEFLAALFDLVA
jgi:hypothetical protein